MNCFRTRKYWMQFSNCTEIFDKWWHHFVDCTTLWPERNHKREEIWKMSTIYLQFSTFFSEWHERRIWWRSSSFHPVQFSSHKFVEREIIADRNIYVYPEVALIEEENEGRKMASLREAKKLKIGHHHSLHGSSAAVNRVNQHHQRWEKFNFPLLFTRRRQL